MGKTFLIIQFKAVWERTYDNVQKIAAGPGDDYSTGCQLEYNYVISYYKMLATDLNKQQALDAYLKVIQQVNFTGNVDRAAGATMFSIIEEAILDFL